MDFLGITLEETKNGTVISPDFLVDYRITDLMVRGNGFYAVWVEEKKLWSTHEQDVIDLVDKELYAYAQACQTENEKHVKVKYLRNGRSKMIDEFHHYCEKQMIDHYHQLDEKLTFSNQKTEKSDYVSKMLPYPLEKGSTAAWDRLISVLYSPDEKRKIEWTIGAIVAGESKNIQKFAVFYGPPGSGKSTVIDIIERLFQGYCSVFDSETLGSRSASFPLEAFKENPLVAIEHDGDLSRIETNTRLNSIVSHETLPINTKYKGVYPMRINSFLFIGTNKPVKITDSKSGLLRRLIDITPTGKTVSQKEYRDLKKRIGLELGAIAWHCRDVYLDSPDLYDDYVPMNMMEASNDFFNFMLDSYYTFKKEDGTSLKAAYEMYKKYCDEAKVSYPYPQRVFKEELKNYFLEYKDRARTEDGSRTRSYFSGFRADKFESNWKKDQAPEKTLNWLKFEHSVSLLDEMLANCPAQYTNGNGTPVKRWDYCLTKLSDIDTKKLHYVKPPLEHIVIDFDIPDEGGEKSFEKNLEEASKWPPTYAELSKSGCGIHLHYLYTGDPLSLRLNYENHIEIKVFNGGASLRRKLTKCNDIPVAVMTSALPAKEKKKMIKFTSFNNDKALIKAILRNLNKENVNGTYNCVNMIYNDLEKAYEDGLSYDVRKMRNEIMEFASRSTHHATEAIKLVNQMKLCSDDILNSDDSTHESSDLPLIFYDVEVFPNLLLICWKYAGKDSPIIRMFNPSPDEVLKLMTGYRLVGFNCRRYDNHILYARSLGMSIAQIYEVSAGIIGKEKNAFFREAYNASYIDIYDVSSIKQSLKKFEIDICREAAKNGDNTIVRHKELGIPWDQPVPEERWDEVGTYCEYDVLATESVYESKTFQADLLSRNILADLAGMSISATTNTLTAKIIFGNDRNPQSQFNYRDLSKPIGADRYSEYKELFGEDYEFHVFDQDGLPLYQKYDGGELPDGYSILPFFPGYVFDCGKSSYLGETIGEGGRVYSVPGMYGDVWDGDITSQHPHSIWAERLFGPVYSQKFYNLVEIRVAIKKAVKSGDFSEAANMMDGKLSKWLTNEDQAKGLANALKIAINSVYGLTSAHFDNLFRDYRNKDNIVAKRGALFMTLLKQEVEKQGGMVAHIKTDSIKIPNCSDEIFAFVKKFGAEYGYNFETEAEFDRFCLVNDAVYIAHEKGVSSDDQDHGWAATGTQFQVPYVFKTLFSRQPIRFEDMCETKQVTTSLYLDMNEDLPEGEHSYRFVGRIGEFSPVRPGAGGGQLVRERKDESGNVKFDSATGAKDYRWLESGDLRAREDWENVIDRSYYDRLVDEAVNDISAYGDFEWFRGIE